MRIRARFGLALWISSCLSGAGAQPPPEAPAAAARAGELVVEPPTLEALGFEWYIDGDDNRNAAVTVHYREKGDSAWREGLPLLRLQRERTVYPPFEHIAPNMFAGSLFGLSPGTEHEVRLRLDDPDGVSGQREHVVTVSTRAAPRPADDGRVFHVYPPDHDGPREEPSFTGLLAAYYAGSAHADWSNAFPPRVTPGDVILVHAGTYRDDRRRYGGGLGTVFDGTYYLTASGSAQRPISIVAAGDGEVVFDGDGNHVLFDLTAADHHYFEGITFRDTELAILAGRKRIAGSEGLAVRHSRFEDVGIGVFTDWAGSRNFHIADNVFVGRQIPDRLMGWIGETWRNLPGFPVRLDSYFAVKVYGAGHVIEHNRISHFHDGISHATYGNPDGSPGSRRTLMPVSIDIHANDIRNVDDNCIEVDGAMHNVRVVGNRCFNQAHRALSAQTLFGGPAYFIRNIVYHAPEGGSVKFHAHPSGVVFYHNTLIGEVHEMGPVSNAHFRNNLVLGQGAWPEVFSMDTFTNYSSSDHNGFRPNPSVDIAFGWTSPPFGAAADYDGERATRKFSTLAEYAAATRQDRHSVLIDFSDFERARPPDPERPRTFYDPDELDFTLRRDSAAIDAGTVLPNVNDEHLGAAPDIGALERGADLPRYGPRARAAAREAAAAGARP